MAAGRHRLRWNAFFGAALADPRSTVRQRFGTGTGPRFTAGACDKIKGRVPGPRRATTGAAAPHRGPGLRPWGKIVDELPGPRLSRPGSTHDPSLQPGWGRVSAGSAANAIPTDGMAEGQRRCLGTTRPGTQGTRDLTRRCLSLSPGDTGSSRNSTTQAQRARANVNETGAHRDPGGRPAAQVLGHEGGHPQAAEGPGHGEVLRPGLTWSFGYPGSLQARHPGTGFRPADSTFTRPCSTWTRAGDRGGSGRVMAATALTRAATANGPSRARPVAWERSGQPEPRASHASPPCVDRGAG